MSKPEDSPARLPSAVFAQRMEQVRTRLGWTQADLAARLDALGLPMHQTTVGRYESGSRSISLDMALSIAAALEQSPVHLLMEERRLELDVDSDGIHHRRLPPKIAVAPNLQVGPSALLGWVRGDRPLRMGDPHWNVAVPPAIANNQITQVAEMVAELRALVIEADADQLGDDGQEKAVELIDAMRSLLSLQRRALTEGQR